MTRRTKRPSRRTRAPARKPLHRTGTGVALAGLAHDIRTPLTGMLALSDLLLASDLPERERGWAAAIKDAAGHLARLTTLVVDAAKAGTGKLILQPEPFALREFHRCGRAIAQGARRCQVARRRDLHRRRAAGPASAPTRCGCAARWRT